MSKALKLKITKYLTTLSLSLALVYSYVSGFEMSELSKVEQYHVLCDAFTLPGSFLILLGLLIVMNNVGALDSLAYAGNYLVNMFIPGGLDRMPSFLDYILARRERRAKGFGFLFVVGGILFAVGLVFLWLYYSVS